jgi:hypothetical protein
VPPTSGRRSEPPEANVAEEKVVSFDTASVTVESFEDASFVPRPAAIWTYCQICSKTVSALGLLSSPRTDETVT